LELNENGKERIKSLVSPAKGGIKESEKAKKKLGRTLK